MRTAYTVSTTPLSIASADADRDWLIVSNQGAADVYLDLTGESFSPVSASNGIKLISGEKLSLTGRLASLQISAISESSSTVVLQGAS